MKRKVYFWEGLPILLRKQRKVEILITQWPKKINFLKFRTDKTYAIVI